jgi:hypothetical protein
MYGAELSAREGDRHVAVVVCGEPGTADLAAAVAVREPQSSLTWYACGPSKPAERQLWHTGVSIPGIPGVTCCKPCRSTRCCATTSPAATCQALPG